MSAFSTTQSKKRKSKTKDPTATAKKVKKDTNTKNPVKDNKNDDEDVNKTVDDQIAGIMEDFGYHDTMNAENYEKYFEKICTLLKPDSVIIIDKLPFKKFRTFSKFQVEEGTIPEVVGGE